MHRSLTRCATCRVSVLDAVTSLAGISIKASARPRPQTLLRQQIRSSQPLGPLRLLRQSSSAAPDSANLSDPSPQDQPESQSSIPWYLQVEEPVPPSTPISPLLARQAIPPLPPNSPPILSSILEALSIQIGLDDLVLLDLRDLDPPPALGSNLLMIIGTARSVKHLNVSADRLCRWVRREYKLRPYADGLLGRNELKLKMRRKARRLKLARSVGNTTMEQEYVDDGITTGWICVNMGLVDVETPAVQDPALSQPGLVDQDDEEEYQNPSEDETYVGFGSRSTSPRIVVQMFTEEKRVEMDLEALWAGRNTRRERRQQRADDDFENALAESELDGEFQRLFAQEQAAKNEVERSWTETATPLVDEVDKPERDESDGSRPQSGMGAS